MKTVHLLIIFILVSCANLLASPAFPRLISFIQPDGSKINIYLKGDERVKWAETEDGYSILFNANGTYEYAVLNNQGDMVPSGRMAKNASERSSDDLIFLLTLSKHLIYSRSQVGIAKQIGNIMLKNGNLLKSFPTKTPSGETSKLLCILIGFTDKKFTKTEAETNLDIRIKFENLFNQADYTVNGATGSVNKFFYESSYGQLNLKVTVAGPYTATDSLVHYGANDGGTAGNDVRPRDLVTEAVIAADADVDYAEFASDGKTVDGVYVIYAGYGEEAGGGSNCIWAHAWSIPTQILDKVNISTYSCSPELSGASGSDITNIGVICHEFGHILGAPDFYDTDATRIGNEDKYLGNGNWDLQSSGNWNNAGKTPAQPNAYTKCYVYNWATATVLKAPGSHITIQNSSAQKTGSFYRMDSATPHEYFLFENRQQVGFDGALPGHGMLVYHVDSAYIAAHTDNNDINAGSHQGMYIMAANSPTANGVSISAESTINTSGCTFSAANGKTSFTDLTIPSSQSWYPNNTSKPLTNITENNIDKTVSFSFMGGNSCVPPTTQASNFQATDITEKGMKISWTRGNGDFVMVVARALAPVDNEPFIGTYYTPNPVFGSSNAELGTGNYVVYNGTGTSVKVTGLSSVITYYYSIYEYNSSGYCYTTSALTDSALTPGKAFPGSSGNTYYDSKITNVVFNTINQVSIGFKRSGYSDYTAIKTAVIKEADYYLSVRLYTDGPYTYKAYAWIDWDNSYTFEASEGIDLGTANASYSDTEGLLTTSSPKKITVPSSAVNGPVRMRVSCKYSSYPTSTETDFDGEVEDYTIVVTSPVSWTGNTSSDWNIGSNWSPAGVPTGYNNVTIPDLLRDPVISSSANSYNVTIESGAVLTIGAAGSLTVNGNLTNNTGTTGLIVESELEFVPELESELESRGTGSLKIVGSVTGSATVNRNISPSHWHIVSPPAIESLNEFLKRNRDIPYLKSDTLKLGMTDYGTDNWKDYFALSTAGSLEVGKGYLVCTIPDAVVSPPPTILNFQGPLKSGTTNVTLSSGWSCIGNPFTSAININNEASGLTGVPNFLSTNSSVLTGSYAAAYFWDEAKSHTEYQVINHASNATYAPVGQGFFIKGTGSVSFTSDMQVHKGSETLKTATVHYPEIKLIASSQNKSFSTTIKFIEDATRGLDVGYDAGLFKSNDSLAIFTKLVEDNGVKFQLQCLPTNQYRSLVIPLGIESKIGGEVVFSVETVQLDPNCKVILEDRLTNTFTDLSNDTYKTMVAANADVSDRFFLHTTDIVSGLEKQDLSSGKLRAFVVGNVEIRLIGEVSDKSVATLYNGLGKVVLTKKLSAGNLNIIGLSNLGSGVYFLNINDKGTTQTIKVVVRK